MDDKEYESRVTQCFISVMHIVQNRRKLKYADDRLTSLIKRMGVDPRILRILDNEYERYLEEKGYKMKTVAQIREDLQKEDHVEAVQNALLQVHGG
jgi:hypothetical protein